MLLRKYSSVFAAGATALILLSSPVVTWADNSSSASSSQSSSSSQQTDAGKQVTGKDDKTGATDSKSPTEKPKAVPCTDECVKCREADMQVQVLVFTLMTVFFFLFVKLILSKLTGQWSLAEALSEEADFGAQGGAPPAGAAGAATGKPVMLASTSRLIALIGTIILTVFFLGLVYYVLWALFNCSKMSAPDDVKLVLYAGIALFAPYATNKLSELFKIGK